MNNVKELYEKLYTCADSNLININLKEIINVLLKRNQISGLLEAELSEKEVLEAQKT